MSSCRRCAARARAIGLGIAVGLSVQVTAPAVDADDPPPDFVGLLRPDLPVEAWFDARRHRGLLRVRQHTSRLYPAYQVAVADLDGDGTREILLGIWSTTRRHDEPEPHRTVWVLAWNEARNELSERWRGSALAWPLRGFTVHDDRLVATERLRQRCRLTTYDWTGFGFAARSVRPIACEDP